MKETNKVWFKLPRVKDIKALFEPPDNFKASNDAIQSSIVSPVLSITDAASASSS